MSKTIILYSTGCPQCRILKSLLDRHSIPYCECNDVALMREKGFDTVPVLEVNGEYLNSKEAQKFVCEGVFGNEEQ